MREVNQIFEKGFSVGLRPFPELGPSQEFLLRCYNLIPTPRGLEPRQVPVAPDVTDNWPFPVVAILSRQVLLFTSKSLYTLDSALEPTFIGTVEGGWGDIPHIADFMDYVVLSSPNGQWQLYKGTLSGMPNGERFKTCTNFRGQLIVGDCQLPKGPEKVGEAVVPNSVEVGGEATVGWTKIGALDWEYTLGNEVGWAPMPWIGSILGLLPLGKEIVVYGTNGLTKLSMAKEPVATFGVQDFGDIGLLNRNCFAGDTTAHLFVGNDYSLYSVTPEKALSGEGKLPSKIGGEEWISQLTDPIVSFDPSRRYWWIGDKKKCFIYSGTGLGEASITPTRLGRLDGALIGSFVRHGDDSAIVETGPTSYASRGIKTLMCVESDLTSSQRVKASAYYKYDYAGQERQTPEIPLDPRSGFFPVIAGVETRVRYTCPTFKDFYLTKMWSHFKNTDKTFARGIINAGRPAE